MSETAVDAVAAAGKGTFQLLGGSPRGPWSASIACDAGCGCPRVRHHLGLHGARDADGVVFSALRAWQADVEGDVWTESGARHYNGRGALPKGNDDGWYRQPKRETA